MDTLKGSMEGLRISTQIEREAEGILRSEGISPQLPIVAEKCGAGGVGNVPLTTNVYGVLMKQMPVYRYDVTVKAYFKKADGTLKWVDFTKKAMGDALVVDRRERCRDVFIIFQQLNKDFLKGSKCVYFDLQAILYSLIELNVGEKDGVKFEIPINKLPQQFAAFSGCELTLRRVDSEFQLTMGDLSCVSRNLSQVEHSLAQFLDLATSQQIIFSPNEHVTLSANTSFLLQPSDHGFRDSDTTSFEDNGSYLAIGAKKSIRFVEGPAAKRGRHTALIVETKKTPFHIVESLLEKAMRMVRDIRNVTNGNLHKLDMALTGIYVETSHLGRLQRFFVKGIDVETAKSKQIVVGEQTLTVQDYFRQKYNITLKEPLAPLVRARGKDNTVCYVPMELCTVLDNQRLKTNQQTPKQVQEMIKKCAIPPSILRQQNDQTFSSLHLSDKNAYIANAGIKVVEHPFCLNGRQLTTPDLQYGGNAIARVRTDNFTWAGKHFLIPANCQSWAAYAFVGPRDRLVERDFEKFIERFVVEAQNRGLRLPRPAAVRVSDIGSLQRTMEEAAKNKIQFVFAVHPDMADDIHAFLKLYERQFLVITQALRMQTLTNMMQKGQPMTLSNVVFKTNVKLGGLNYSVSITSPGAKDVLKSGTLFIGISSNHPGGGLGNRDDDGGLVVSQGKQVKLSAPSIVGYSANYGLVHEFEFIGDFVCQQPLREEKVEVIRQIVERCVTKYRENRKSEPKRIVMYRNGASEGQFAMVLKYEVPLIKLALSKLKCGASLNIVVPNKLQSIRFFCKDIDPRAKPSDQNIKPGLVVDHSVVHPEFSEFFLNSHRALQGTAKTPKYTLLLNESKFGLDQLEEMTYVLCYGHQIVQMPTSLPSPVYIAGRYAERGRKLYTSSNSKSASKYSEMTENLCYYGTSLADKRVNA